MSYPFIERQPNDPPVSREAIRAADEYHSARWQGRVFMDRLLACRVASERLEDCDRRIDAAAMRGDYMAVWRLGMLRDFRWTEYQDAWDRLGEAA